MVLCSANISLARLDLWHLIDRADRHNDWPRRKCKKRSEDQRFNRKLHVILARKEISSELEKGSTARCCCLLSSENGSFNFDYAHAGD
jgi:hypothetical protein